MFLAELTSSLDGHLRNVTALLNDFIESSLNNDAVARDARLKSKDYSFKVPEKRSPGVCNNPAYIYLGFLVNKRFGLFSELFFPAKIPKMIKVNLNFLPRCNREPLVVYKYTLLFENGLKV